MPIYVQDKRLTLPDGRTLAYADNGNTSSMVVVISLHGIFGVGDASRISPALATKQVHLIAPSLPGWGETSPCSDPKHYATTIIQDIRALLFHLHPDHSKFQLHICGYDFGSIAAQILYGAPYVDFPAGRQIKSLVLLAPCSPPHCDSQYSKGISWWEYLLIGPPWRYIPFNMLPWSASVVLARKLATLSRAEDTVRQRLFNVMAETEYEQFGLWKDSQGVSDGQLEREWAANMQRSVATSWRGFLDLPAIYHSGWGGFYPDKLDVDHTLPQVVIVTPSKTQISSRSAIDWLCASYTHSNVVQVEGGHLAAILHLDNVFTHLLS